MSETTALAVIEDGEQFPVLVDPDQAIAQVLRENVGGGALTQFDFSRIRLPSSGGRSFQIPSLAGSSEVPQIAGIIVGWRDGRAYWSRSYDESGGAPPDCSSQDSIQGHGSPGGNCQDCPLSKFGSAPAKGDRESRGQACRQARFMFLLRPGARLPTVIAAPPTSLKQARNYFLALANENLPYWSVVTRLGLEPDKNADGVAYSKLVFACDGALTGKLREGAKAYKDSVAPILGGYVVDAEAIREGDSGAGQPAEAAG